MADETQKPNDLTRPANQSLPPKRRQQPIERKERSGEDLDDRISHLSTRLESLAGRLGGDDRSDSESSSSSPLPIRERRLTRSGTVNGEAGLNELLQGGKAAVLPSVSPPAQPNQPSVEQAPLAEDPVPPGTPTRPTAQTAPATGPRGISPATHRRQLKTVIFGALAYAVIVTVLALAAGWIVLSGRSEPADDSAQTSASQEKGADHAGSEPAENPAMQSVNAALKAYSEGDYDQANKLYNDLARQDAALPGLNYRVGLLAIRRGDSAEGDIHLLRSIRAGEEVAASYYARATFAGIKGDYTNAARSFEAATHADPFSARLFFYWAECLRRDGKPLAAVSHFDETLYRAMLESDADYVRFKRNLARIEAGDTDFLAEVVEKARQPNPSGDALLLAAANDIEQGNFPAAAEHLQRASQALPPAEFNLKIADYLFQAQRERPALSAILAKARPTPKSDPSAWGMQEADPATWPAPRITVNR